MTINEIRKNAPYMATHYRGYIEYFYKNDVTGEWKEWNSVIGFWCTAYPHKLSSLKLL